MTNFDKWREGLTPERLFRYFEDGFFDGCTDCPAAEFCKGHMKDHEDCFEVFKVWANMPA